MTENKKSLTCQRCHKWFAEESLLITPHGAFCEECYPLQSKDSNK